MSSRYIILSRHLAIVQLGIYVFILYQHPPTIIHSSSPEAVQEHCGFNWTLWHAYGYIRKMPVYKLAYTVEYIVIGLWDWQVIVSVGSTCQCLVWLITQCMYSFFQDHRPNWWPYFLIQQSWAMRRSGIPDESLKVLRVTSTAWLIINHFSVIVSSH